MNSESVYYIVETSKTFEQASTDLEAAVKRNAFGVLHIHDLGNTLRSKGVDFAEQCKVFEICNPAQASKVLATDIRINMALPCRISVYTEQGKTSIGMIRPMPMLTALSQDATLVEIARQVETQTTQIIDEAR